MPFLAKQWSLIHDAEGMFPDWKEFWRIIECYNEKHRSYHALDHLIFGLKEIERLGKELSNRTTVTLAYFYHDIRYDPHRKDNEEVSAIQLREYAQRRGFSPHRTTISFNLVIETSRHMTSKLRSPHWKLMSDADMAIFATPPKTYMKYAKGIWSEYSFVGIETYVENRCKFLKSLDGLKILWLPDGAMTKAERNNIAQKNVALELATLQECPALITG
jgi:predicted metal-dependent HD superfamily phosphohydrolase